MIVNIKPLLDGETSIIPFEHSFVLHEDGVFDDIVFTDPVHLKGEIVGMSGYMLLRVRAELNYKTQCARCLKELERSITVEFEKNVAASKDMSEENDDYIIVESAELDLVEPLVEQLFLELPYKHLCSEDCRGLCSRCGADLNLGKCSCPEKEIDPRLAVLKQLLD